MDSITESMAPGLTLNQWSTVFVSYSYTYGGFGISAIYIDGQFTNIPPRSSTGYLASAFSTSDVVKFGGGFIGKLRRFQVYSPAGFRPNEGS